LTANSVQVTARRVRVFAMIGEIALIAVDPKCAEWCSEPNG